ncbi:bacillithiol biosynthesis cysteine-adding enzyme BshC [Pontibacillus sp. HMF3514]|uniref:bacillithiol biosynthesis cysteine-adding enzyme BshC n=1 Tax=Pontibacillus sp. HMF3514 TaxID=2692425 RepID=UPI00131FECF1|nr:bacillithiol biosynthesis cysteine-adding enzyme BshC [Pontibacillus sp. HMF3514]QHE52092.1 bacillithiol biosynthesis cysteine-adding enzyme BshC [Pontibacillus sp. HMF3514]
MRIQPIDLTNENRLMQDYRSQSNHILQKFHYNPYKKSDFKQRLEHIQKRSYKRDELADHLHQVNSKWGAPEQTLSNIEKVRDPESVVVVGGQQAGLLTGPLYTIHKIISILVLAEQQESELGIPVLPVFWIAGEDHDFDEINHIHMPYGQRMKKFKIMQKQNEKLSVSDMEMDEEAIKTWLERLFSQLDETELTNDLYHNLLKELAASQSFVDYFARILFYLFPEKGLILMDSDHPELRELESDYFKDMIRNQERISEGVVRALHESAQQGYPINLEADSSDGHLFYEQGGRTLLVRNEEGNWEGKQNECSFTTEELLQIAEENPEKLSNNVVTRPLMQELVLPTLSFIAGPGEVGYWAALKPAFEALDIEMPPVTPRLSISLLDRKSEKWMNKHSLQVQKAVNEGVSEDKNYWISMQSYPPIEQLSDEVKKAIERAHRPLKEKAHSIRDDIGQLAEKNLFELFRDVEFLQERMIHALEDKHTRELEVFDAVDLTLNPEGKLQERTWNILPWINKYGITLGERLCDIEYDWTKPHHVVYL